MRGAAVLSSVESATPSITHVARRGPIEPREQAEQRRLAGSARADDGDRRAGRDVERDGVEDRQRLVAALHDFGERMLRG